MNGDYGAGLAAFGYISVWTLWIGVAALVIAVGIAIWLAVRAER
ncbi:hypothetical protein [Bradyrhizobium sp. 168]|nr:hypothetical protein [Bradyrhizobium sp. 168]